MAATTDDPLVALASYALGFVRDGAVVGLGSGRAARAFVQAFAARIREGLRARGVATSDETAHLARELGIDLVGLEADIDLTVDGADEVDPTSTSSKATAPPWCASASSRLPRGVRSSS
jgi:ribose 5-phosphate isomerase A